MDKEISSMSVRYSPFPSTLPNKYAPNKSSFEKNLAISKLQYDDVVFDTYDYIDKVIGLSLSDPVCAAFQMYSEKTGDIRAKQMCNYIRYGTNDEIEIWLLRYGFSFEEIAWISELVEYIDENCIQFNGLVKDLDDNRKKIIERYM